MIRISTPTKPAPSYPFNWPAGKPSRESRKPKRKWKRKADGLTGNHRPAQTERTTTVIGNTAPHKPRGIFVPFVQRSGLLPRHQGQRNTPVFRIGKLRFTRAK
jgi:hypothetical protein